MALVPLLLSKNAILSAVIACLWFAVAWITTGIWAEGRVPLAIERGQQEAKAGAAAISANIDYQLNHFRSIPAVMSREPQLASLLAKLGPTAKLRLLPMADRVHLSGVRAAALS